MATESDKEICREILARLNLAVKFPPVHLIYLLQDSNGSICFEQECWASCSISDQNNSKSPFRACRYHRTPSFLRQPEGIAAPSETGGKVQPIDPDITITHGVSNKQLPPEISVSMEAEKVANSAVFVSSPGLSVGHVL